jgi:anti-sigma factor RsiW
MTCGELREQIAAYAAGWMDDAARRMWESHRDACPACAAEAARDARLVRLLASAPAVEPRPVAWPDVLGSSNRSRRRWAPAFAGAAATLALAAGSFQLWRGRDIAPTAVVSDTSAYVAVHTQISTASGMSDPNTMVLLNAVREENG